MDFAKETRSCLLVWSKFFMAMALAWILVLCSQATCFAAGVTIQWDPNDDPDLSGYKVYYQADSPAQPFQGTGATQGASPVLVDKLATTATISGLDPGHVYYFAVTAINTSGAESVYSNLASFPEGYSITDALMALRVSVGLTEPTSYQKNRLDVAPLQNGTPSPDGIINITDALLILKRTVGLISW